ncbi:MAG: glycosyltransferase family 9 protein [Nitrospirae bacterium]|nr:glycosyltransferase family 9 protein [Nitrospirota bacterium]MBF0535080.1 glycosyltransferase family 9 protein [Nitrospirota bacterium]MBF0615370.1 glycosyltransferase family 9 protein [Nitrospirota bacterium]
MKLNPVDSIVYVLMKLLKRFFDSRLCGIEYFEPTLTRRILIISSTALGDTLLSTPAIAAVRRRYPEAAIFALIHTNYMELVATNPHIDEFIPYYGGYKKFLETTLRLRKLKPDTAFILHGNEPQATPLAYLAGARFIFKIPIPSQYGFLLSNHTNGFTDSPWQHHAISVRLKTASFAGCKEDDLKMVLPVSAQDSDTVKHLFHKLGFESRHVLIGLQPGAALSYKMWPQSNFTSLGKKLVELIPDVRIVVTGSKAERALCTKIATDIGQKAVPVCGELPLRLLGALIKELTVLITNDTGTMHVAIAVGTKTVSLFCPSNHWGVGRAYDFHLHKVIYKERPCDPCITKKCKNPHCMEQISLEDVFSAVKELLGKDSYI